MASGASAAVDPWRSHPASTVASRSLSARLALSLAGMIVVGGFAAGVVLALEDRSDRIALSADQRAQDAQEFAGRLSISMHERVRDVLLLAEQDAFVGGDAATRRRMLEQLGAGEEAYAWLGATDTAGVVEAASPGGLLEGVDVSQRPWWLQAQTELFVGDLHEALLLAERLTGPGEQPPRFVDIATPVVDDGQVVGVLGTHLYWAWADRLRQQVRAAGTPSDVDYLVFDRAGQAILPPQRTAAGQQPPVPQAPLDGDRGHGVVEWTDGRYVTGWATAPAEGGFDGLGWTAVTRRPLAAVTSSSVVLGSGVVAAAVVMALLVAALAWWWIHRQTAKLRTITTAAQQLRDGHDVELPQFDDPAEVAVLSAAMRELTDHLATRNRELTDALRAREQFTMMASHETRTPITVIKGAVQTLQQHNESLSGPVRDDLIDAIVRNTDRLERLNRHLLAAAEIEVGKAPQDLMTEHVRPAEVIRDIAAPHVHVEGPDGLVVETDKTLLELTVGNLLDNAAKYGQPPVHVTLDHTDGHLRVNVRDHGTGVPPDFVARLFDRYAQASEGVQRVAVGVGLGLWLSQQLLRRVGGDLTHDPVDGPGAHFTALIPAAPA